jgi:CubicO group peptidase (beta-lactamase class C family)
VSIGRLGKLFLLVLAWQIAIPLTTEAREPCGVPEARGDWPIETQARLDVDSERLCDLIDRLASLDAGIHSVLMVRGGKLTFEHYRPGGDERWGVPVFGNRQGPDIKHDVRSVSKSVTSLLLGIAIDRKLIAGVDSAIFDFFPEYRAARSPAKDSILIKHLLTMSSGFDWNERVSYRDPQNSEVLMNVMPEPYRYVLDRPLAAEPGTRWNYSGGDVALISAIIQKASGQRLEDFARKVLFEPLGIVDFEWSNMGNGDAAAASGLRLRPRDMAKLGELVLRGGTWNGKSIVPAEWLRESMMPRFPAYIGHYGYLWWIDSASVGQTTVEFVEAYGLGGQRIIIIPTLDMVVVITTGRYNIPEGWKLPDSLFKEFILPAVIRQ